MDKKRLKKIAQTLSAQPRGILAADESTGTIGKRFEQISLKSTIVIYWYNYWEIRFWWFWLSNIV